MNQLSEFVLFVENTLNRPLGVLLIVFGLFFFLLAILLRLNTIENRIAETIVISLGTLLIVTGAVIHAEISTLLKPFMERISEVRGERSEVRGERSAEVSPDPAPRTPKPEPRPEISPEPAPLSPHLFYILTNQFEFVWNDKGNKSLQNATVYKPLAPAGYKILGYYIQSDYKAPQGKAFAVKISSDFEKEGVLAYPSGYTCIWYDVGGNTGGAIWRPIPPLGYRCLGDIVTQGLIEPDRKEIVCVRETMVTEGKLGNPIWDNKGSGSTREISVCPADAADPEKGFPLNLFQGYERNMSRSTVFSALPVLRKDCISPEVRSEK